jgi:acetate kinase
MNIFTFIPLRNKLQFAIFSDDENKIIKADAFSNFRGQQCLPIMEKLKRKLEKKGLIPDFAVIKVPFGGEVFKGPILFNEETLQLLSEIIPFAPLPIPAIIELAKTFSEVFPGKKLVLLFETAFFVDLPVNEKFYAIPKELSESLKLRRFGYHGLYHLNTMKTVYKKNSRARIISVCLEPRPEIAAIRNGKAVFVTGGATPLEGLPGERTSGEIDPFIITTIAEKLGWGPEQINRMLCSFSGIYGILGTETTLINIFEQKDKKSRLARNIMQYKILLACGAAIASMKGCDDIVFSGIYSSLSSKLKKYLKSKLNFSNVENVTYSTITDSIEEIMAKQALSFIQQKE